MKYLNCSVSRKLNAGMLLEFVRYRKDHRPVPTHYKTLRNKKKTRVDSMKWQTDSVAKVLGRINWGRIYV